MFSFRVADFLLYFQLYLAYQDDPTFVVDECDDQEWFHPSGHGTSEEIYSHFPGTVFASGSILIDKQSIALQRLGLDIFRLRKICHGICLSRSQSMTVPRLRRWEFHDASAVEQARAVLEHRAFSLDRANFPRHVEELTELER
ncbi:hypothetical protein SCLCIDRAFT_21088 [Scleroderma citrinum Foug A]|uniref:Uncharacterized protein n=1 Tax=Scleroderma citrinum Foug A TaxID=1036808 RepID=A0A0C3EH00_9AGAM|nr:hypothetical protein SCLCIDRAFT_21088 [Scleroderma citrinum Foug A]